jgi:poly-gamma-glutamate synthesis protein (capsule biosynthesis protein)
MGVGRPIRGGSLLLAILFVLSLSAVIGARIAAGRIDPLEPYPWVYLRGDQPLKEGETLLSLITAGDTSLARGVDPRTAFTQSQSWLGTADFTFVNLECALSAQSARVAAENLSTGPYRLVAPPSTGEALRRAGISVVSLANNHTLDAGPAGLEETALQLDALGIAAVGAGEDAAAAQEPVTLRANGFNIAILAFNAIPSPDPLAPGWTVARWERGAALAAVRRAAILSDGVVVSMHWGIEYQPRASPAQAELAQALIAAGADLVIGHHPHATQELLVDERAGGTAGLAALSLGNFAFDQGEDLTGQGLALRAFFDRDGLRAVQALPLSAGPRPALKPPGEDAPDRLASPPRWEEAAFTCTTDPGGEDALCGESTPGSTAEPGAGFFHSGQIDLTGDGLPEEVRLDHFHVTILSQGELDWQSPPEWRVLDLAAGDVDGDGRGDLVFALEKPDKQGNLQSHPFVIGFRGGYYGTVWGGSPVRDPVKEVELGDLDGDGETELIVLEEERQGKGRAVTVWRWHGWGFSLDWRSPYGQYEDMQTAGQEIRVRKLKDQVR